MTPAPRNAWPEPKTQVVAADILVRRRTTRWITKHAGGGGGGGGGIATIVPALLTAGGALASTSHASSSITVAAGDLVQIYVAGAFGTNVDAIPTPTGAGQTWLRPSALGTQYPDVTPNAPRRAAVFYAIGVPGSGAVTFATWAHAVDCVWVITKYTGVDLTNPFVYMTMLSTAANGTSQTLYMRKFRDAVNNGLVAHVMAGNGTDDISPGTGFTLLGHSTAGGSLPTLGTMFRLGEDTTADWSWSTSASNWAFGVELRANGAAADPSTRYHTIGKGGQTASSSTHSLTTAFSGAPVYTGADLIYLAFFGQRTGALPADSTCAGGGVTWSAIPGANQTFDNDGTRDIRRAMVFCAVGPLDGTDVVVTHPAAQSNFNAWMFAIPGAVKTNGGLDSAQQVVTGQQVATSAPSVTLAANANANNGVVGIFCMDSSTNATIRCIPGGGLVTVDHREQSAGATGFLDPQSNGRLFAEAMPYNATVIAATMPTTADTASIGIEVKAA